MDKGYRQVKKVRTILSLAGVILVCVIGFILMKPEKAKEEVTLPVHKVEADDIEDTDSEPLITPLEEVIEETIIPASIINEPQINGKYDIKIKMEKENTFHVSADITVINTSADSWQDVGFYFLPNAFTKENKPEFMKDSASFTIRSIKSIDEDLEYDLLNNKLLVKLKQDLQPDEEKIIRFDYTMNLPENGIRFSKVGNNYYLTQWYPMIGTYDGGWNIADYDSTGESYHTGYGNFTVSYKLFQPYIVASSGVEGQIQPKTEGTIHGQYVKDFYLSFLDKETWDYASEVVNDTEVRVFVPKHAALPVSKYLSVGVDSFGYFEDKIGDNPNKQLDIIVNNGGMEYPNVVEVAEDEQLMEKTIAHEVAHQWFYYLVSNDQYHEAWLDEGITEFSTSLYLTEKYDVETGFDFATQVTRGLDDESPDIVNLPLNEFNRNYGAIVYGKSTLKLKEFFDANGGSEEAWSFLSGYYQANQYTITTTKVFVDNFVGRYGEQKEFLESWLDI